MAAQTIPGIAIIVFCVAGIGALPYYANRFTRNEPNKVSLRASSPVCPSCC